MPLRSALFALAISLSCTTALADAPAASAAAPVAAPDRFAGMYTYVGGDKQKAAIDAAIDKAIEGLFFAVKPIARGKLHGKTEVKTRIGFAFAGGNITSTANGEAPATSAENGTTATFKAGGDDLRLAQKLTADGHLVQSFAAPEGTRLNDYVLAADGKTLTVAVLITSSKLTHPLRYVLTYRKN